MEFSATWLEMLILLGGVQGFFLSFIVYKKQNANRQAVRYLAYLLSLVSFLMLCRVAYQPSFFYHFAEVIMLPDAILFLVGPLIYFFIRSLLQLPPLPKPRFYAHYAPAVFHIFVINTILGLNLNGFWSFLSGGQILIMAFAIEAGAIVSLSAYLALSFKILRDYRHAFLEKYQAPFIGDFLKPFFVAGFALALSWAYTFTVHRLIGILDYTSYYAMWGVLVAYIYWLGYAVLMKPEVLELPALRQIVKLEPSVVQKVETYMLSEKPFLDPDLKLGDMADALNMPRHELSKLINHAFGRNFFDYLNNYRVQEFVQLRKDPRRAHHNILDLAYQSGFNSKSAFNRAFRKEMGEAPSTYFKKNGEA